MSTHVAKLHRVPARPSPAHQAHIQETERVIATLRRLIARCHRTGVSYQDCYMVAYDEVARKEVRRLPIRPTLSLTKRSA